MNEQLQYGLKDDNTQNSENLTYMFAVYICLEKG